MNKPKSYIVTLLTSFFLGGIGVHRFYTGYIGLGFLQLFTAGGCGIWSLIDFISICFNNYQTSDGQPLQNYNKTLGMTFFFIWVAFMGIALAFYAAGLAAATRG